jgi:ATP-dependent protease HslVU (ClpYQ) peptidase subunit
MTTVCWDGKTMAADKQMTLGNMRHTNTQGKILRGEYHGLPALFAGAGTKVHSAAVIEWLVAGMPDERKPEMPEGPDSFTVFVVTEHGLYLYVDSLRPIPLGICKWAIGSGEDYAHGAMAAGANAKKAVEIACSFDINSGMGVETLTLRKR